jgi:RecA-family ATPase
MDRPEYVDSDEEFKAGAAKARAEGRSSGKHWRKTNGGGTDARDEPLPKLIPIRFANEQRVPEHEWTAQGWIPKEEVTLVQGDGGLGKSTIVQQLQTSCATERPWLGQLVEQCASVGFYTEDKQRHLEIRQAAINRAYEIDHNLTTAMALFPRRGEDNELVVFDRSGKPILTDFYKQVCEAAQDYHARLVVLDVAVDLYGGDEIKRRQVRAFVRTLNNLADTIAGSVVMTGHVSQAGLQSDGGHSASTDWSNAVRSRLYLGQPKDKGDGPSGDANARVFTRKKSNFAGIGDTIELHWCDGVFMPDAPVYASPFRRTIEDVFLHLLDAVTREGQTVSAKPKAGTYAPSIFMMRSTKERDNYRRGDFERAMQDLLQRQRIKIVPYGPPSDKTQKLIRADAENLS